MKRRHLVGFAAFAAISASCTPPQLQKLGVSLDSPSYGPLLALEDKPVPLEDGSTLELDGSVSPAPVYAHPNPNVQRWYPVALDAGWSPGQWRWLSCIIDRESDGNPRESYRERSGSISRGLTQTNSVWVRWLRERGIVNSAADLFDPSANLRSAREIYAAEGPGPWRSSRPC